MDGQISRRDSNAQPKTQLSQTNKSTPKRKQITVTNKQEGEYYVPYIPISLRQEILRTFHDEPEAGHLATKTTLREIKERCYWDNMNKEIREYCKNCEVCQQSKADH